ncbi:uncharacterized protein VTP21DRAFT_10813 [Calcarisporiella thermophila]|uniref:uncharacterized protein n=1 Tax=Calcarisporiella thermophila TaxID=911321 RepID=UPI00374227C2
MTLARKLQALHRKLKPRKNRKKKGGAKQSFNISENLEDHVQQRKRHGVDKAVLEGKYGNEADSIHKVARALFQDFKRDLWRTFPNPTRHLADPASQNLESINFDIKEIKQYVRNPRFLFSVRVKIGNKKFGVVNGMSWRQRFRMYFNLAAELNGKGMQGWKSLPYLNQYRELCRSMTKEQIMQLDDFLLEHIMRMECLPKSYPRGKVWCTHAHFKQISDSDPERIRVTCVDFVLNENLVKEGQEIMG